MTAAPSHISSTISPIIDTEQENDEKIIRNPVQSQSPPSTANEDSPPNTAYENWSVRDDSINLNNETGDDLAWKIISIVLKGWCITWILFAILIISADIFSPSHSTKAQNKNTIVTVEDEQLLLEISENIVTSCSYSNLDTLDGREGCQALCENHMCCFIDDEDASFQSHRYGCANDPEKICAAYAGCESLVVSQDDAAIFDADGLDVFGVGDSADDTSSGRTPSNKQPQPQGQSQSSNENANIEDFTTSSLELQLMQRVVTSVCSNVNLHTRHGILECASLCNTSMCCFDRGEIEFLNPKIDLILKMEDISDEVLDRSSMGTCINEEEGDATLQQRHFCQVHAGCKHVLLLGSPSAANAKTWTPSSGDASILTSEGVYIKDNQMLSSSSITGEQQRMLVTVCVSFGMMIGLSVYLLVYKRDAPFNTIEMTLISRLSNSNGNRAHDQEMVEFV